MQNKNKNDPTQDALALKIQYPRALPFKTLQSR